MSNSRSNVFLGGIPTEPDVKKLMEAYPDIKPEELISYQEIAEIIGVEAGSARFRTVTTRWRKRLKAERGYRLEPVIGQGFERITEQDRSRLNVRGWTSDQRRASRKVRDQLEVKTAELDEQTLKTHDHQTNRLVRHMEETRRVSREIMPPSPPKQIRGR